MADGTDTTLRGARSSGASAPARGAGARPRGIRRTVRAATLALAAAVALCGCTVARLVPYIPNPTHKGITHARAKEAIEDVLSRARTQYGHRLLRVEVDERSMRYRWGYKSGIQTFEYDVDADYRECWIVCGTDIIGGPAGLPFAAIIAKGEEVYENCDIWFERLEDVQTLIDAFAAMGVPEEPGGPR